MPFCKQCGAKMDEDDSFCPQCGHDEGKASESRKTGKTGDLKEMSVFWLFILSCITLGIYNARWFSKQKDGINSLRSDEQISGGTIIFLWILQIVIAFLVLTSKGQPNSVVAFRFLCSAVNSILIWVLSFKIKRMLEQHFKQSLSGVATFFFVFYYLQYKINRLVKKA
ncbi:DUF4234 domain-containing protein [Candidatus Woesearchaeota archaeon]|nr:DUF4234 domain-containing protein [Candidatus Woesearchaeota archaeon]